MHYTTSGERLFFLVRDEVFPSFDQVTGAWSSLREIIDNISGTKGLHDYLRGALAVHAIRRLLRMWKHAMKTPIPEHLRVGRAARLATTEVFPGLERTFSQRLGRLLVDAAAASDQQVSAATRKRVLSKAKVYHCYICGFLLNANAKQSEHSCLTLEHLWPASLGGESVDDNLLPACRRCQDYKADAVSWEWTNVHNVVLPQTPSADALASVPWPVRIARHHMHVIEMGRLNGLSLKESFLRVGPIATLSFSTREYPVTFFHLQTAEE